MLSFKEWIELNKKKKGTKNGKQYDGERGRESGHINHEGQTDRTNQTISEPVVYVFAEP